mgnify:CR=1 FL=1
MNENHTTGPEAGKEDRTMSRPKAKARPRNKPFDDQERQYLCGLDAVCLLYTSPSPRD